MSIVQNLDTIVAWVQANICAGLSFKVPDDKKMDASYQYKTATPTTFPLFIPAKDRQPPTASGPIPSCCVQVISGKDAPTDASRTLRIRLSFATWSPGLHGSDNFEPDGTGTFKRTTEQTYQKNEDGWRDAWNFLDKALSVLQSNDTMSGIRIASELGFDFGPFVDEQKAIPNFWPYWFTWAEFYVDVGITRRTSHDALL